MQVFGQKRSWWQIAVGTFMLGAPLPNYGQAAQQGPNSLSQVRTQPDTTRPSLSNSTIHLHELTVSEHRSEAQQLLQVQSQLAGSALAATRGQSLGESLKQIAGLYSIQTGPSLSKPVIHGLYSNRIVTLNNGIRQEDQQWGNEHAPQIDAFVASRITVIKGAASIRYGSDAIGGVILVEPKAMPTQPGVGGELNLVGATNGRMGAVSGFLEGAFGKALPGLSWRVQGTVKRAGYTQTPRYYLENSSFRETNLSADLHYDRKHWGIEAYVSHFRSNVGLFRGAQVGSLSDLYAAINRPEPLQQPGFSYALNRPFQDVQHTLLKVRTYVQGERLGTLTATVAQQQNERNEYDLVAFSGRLNPELYLSLTTHTLDVVWEHRPRTHERAGEAAGRWVGSVGFNGITQGNIRRFLFLIPNYRTYGGGLFAIERYVRGRWAFEGGLRYDYRWLRAFFRDEATDDITFNTHQWRNANGSLGASFDVRPDLTLTANLSTAWRAPHVADLYANGLHQSAAAYEIGNPNLRPEQAYNGNLVLAYAGKRLTAEVGLYSNRIQNFIYLRPDSVPIIRQRGAFPSFSYTQVDATFRGLDLTLTYLITSRLSVTSKTSLLWALNQSERTYLVGIPPNRTDNSLRYDFKPLGPQTKLYARLSGLFVARQTRAPATTQQLTDGGRIIFTGDFAPPPPAYALLGAELGLTTPLWGHTATFILTGANLTNTIYRDYLNRFRYFADEPGRNISLKISIPFSL
jgi:iron complex outermembrane recepter protein